MKKILIVCYGGGHANIVKSIYPVLTEQVDAEITILALTAAPKIFIANNIPFKTLSHLVCDLECYDEIVRLGTQFGAPLHNNNMGIEFEDTIAYYGCGMYDLIHRFGKEEAFKMFSEKGRKAFLPVLIMEMILNKLKPDVVVITSSPRMEMAAGIVADKLSIPVVRINDLPVSTTVEHRCTLCVMNEWAKKYAIHEANNPEESVIVTGQPIFEEELYLNNDKLNNVKDYLELDQFNRMVLFFTRNGIDETPVINKIYEIAQKMSDTLFVIKLHPNQEITSFQKSELTNVRIEDGAAVYYIALCDLAITSYSTTGMEAALMNKPLIEINIEHEEYPLNYDEMGIAVLVDNLNVLEKHIMELLDKQSAEYCGLEESRKSFMNHPNARENICSIIKNKINVN